MKTKFLYIHGLGSDAQSRKYLNIKNHFQDQFRFDCLEWKNEDDIEELLLNFHKELSREENLILFGDSTGANFALQLREMRSQSELKTILILSSPLLDESKRIASFPFPEHLKPFLKKYNQIDDLLMILPTHDEVIDNNWLFKINSSSVKLIQVEDSHRLLKFENYLSEIVNYIEINK